MSTREGHRRGPDVTPRRRWQVDGHVALAVLRPDDRWVVKLPEDRGSWPRLVAARPSSMRRLLVLARARSAADEDALRAAGFSPGKTDQVWRVPLAGIPDRPVTSDTHRLLPVLECDPERVTRLDNALRQAIPGTVGWTASVDDFLETLDDDELDPDLYLVAEHRGSGSYDGLVRVWFRRPLPRLGCVGVTAPWRRTRLVPHLLATVASRMRARGIEEVVTETDTANRAAYLLARNHGASPESELVEWVLEASPRF